MLDAPTSDPLAVDVPAADAPCDLAALVYDEGQDPDALLHAFAADLRAHGVRAVGLVQSGDRAADRSSVHAVLVHSGERLALLQDLGPLAEGCRLDVGQLLSAGARVASALDQGADVLIINRFGKLEREGQGLSYLIDRALSDGIPVIIAVPSRRLDDWTGFAGGMSVQLDCSRAALDQWWAAVS